MFEYLINTKKIQMYFIIVNEYILIFYVQWSKIVFLYVN